MRIGELSRRADVPIATIKYYLREGLLRSGERMGPNQARYTDGHVRQLKMIRAMVEVGKLSVSVTKEVMAAVERGHPSATQVLDRVTVGSLEHVKPSTAAELAAKGRVDELIAAWNWPTQQNSPAVGVLVNAIAVLYDLDREDLVALLEPYAAASVELANVEKALIQREGDVEGLLVATIIGDVVLSAVRRLAR